MLHFEVDLSRFRHLREETLRELTRGTAGAVRDGLRHAVDFARANHPHQNRTKRLIGRNGELFFRIQYNGTRGTEGFLINETPYARFVEYGTRPHDIVPTGGRRALRWVQGGRTRFAARVHHPGNRPLPFMAPAAIEGRRAIERALLLETLPKLANIWK